MEINSAGVTSRLRPSLSDYVVNHINYSSTVSGCSSLDCLSSKRPITCASCSLSWLKRRKKAKKSLCPLRKSIMCSPGAITKTCAYAVPGPFCAAKVIFTLNSPIISRARPLSPSALHSSATSLVAGSFEANRVSLLSACSLLSNMGVKSIPPSIVISSKALIFCKSSSPSSPTASPNSASAITGSRLVPSSFRSSSSVKPPSRYHALALISSIVARFAGSVRRMEPSSPLALLPNQAGNV
mmetsp:Transcript_20462/g.48406  ORF Transcript_20462/g.48406 Transcript_20462/m.48406 type:complete len:241 (+) Transcript_20462:43-765(+)